MLELIPEKGRFYKANLHCHTNISDGHNTPEEVKALYKSLGFHETENRDEEEIEMKLIL